MDWERKWLVDLNTGKSQLVSFDQSNNTDWCYQCENGESVLEEKSSFKILGLTFSSKLDCCSSLSLLPKVPP